jgi:hypothetical protein
MIEGSGFGVGSLGFGVRGLGKASRTNRLVLVVVLVLEIAVRSSPFGVHRSGFGVWGSEFGFGVGRGHQPDAKFKPIPTFESSVSLW